MEQDKTDFFEDEEKEFIQDTGGKTGDDVVKVRKDAAVNFLKKNYKHISYLILAFIVFIAVKIRTKNLPGLKDVTTGTWTLGPDLDPFLFLRWAKYIVEHGSLFAVDTMRYVPIGFETGEEYLLHPYMMAWFHKFIGPFLGVESVTHSAVLYPVFFFALTVVAFFFLVRKLFVSSMGDKNANAIALIAAFFLSVMPSLLPRTIAGIPEKESVAFFFLFASFYLFLKAWESKKILTKVAFGILAGVATTGMATIWGGFGYIFLIISPAAFIAFLFWQVDKSKIYVFVSWLISSFVLMLTFSDRYDLNNLLNSVTTGSAVFVLLVMVVHFVIFRTKLRNYLDHGIYTKVPRQVVSVVAALILVLIFGSVLFGVEFVPAKAVDVFSNLVKPAQSRLIQTVAENRQPYFTEWSASFGPSIRGIPVTFWLAIVGSAHLFLFMINHFRKKDRWVMMASYLFFLFAIIFSRHSANSTLNGTNTASLTFYALGFIVFICTFGYYYVKNNSENGREKFRSIDFGLLFVFLFFFLSVISARGAVRLIMVLAIAVSIIVSYFVVAVIKDFRKSGKDWKTFMGVFAAIVLVLSVFSAQGLYRSVDAQAGAYIPSAYTQQWQRAMGWVRSETPENSVFGHWWDYGYWIQSIGERATVLDGGNAVSYWNHLMGRHALTGTSEKDALEFLYVHNTTHFLIDSTDIGKYSAYSLIGSDSELDRASFVPVILRNNQAVQEKKNSTIFYYQGGVGLDEDIVWENNQSKIFLPAGSAALGAVGIERNVNGEIVGPPIGVFVYQGQQYSIPLKYAYINGELQEFEEGIESGVYLFPRLAQSGAGVQMEMDGAMIYLSSRTVKSQMVKLYLYGEESEGFRLAHSQPDLVVSQIRAQNPGFESDIVYYQGLRGPIKIWEINYPEDIEFKEEYLSTVYPEEIYFGR